MSGDRGETDRRRWISSYPGCALRAGKVESGDE
jgi:hypothetical protein